MKILHTEQGFTAQDKLKFRSVIYSNIVRNMKILSDAIDKLNIPLGAPEVRKNNVNWGWPHFFKQNQNARQVIATWSREVDLDPFTFNDYVPHLIALWNDTGIQVSGL